MFGIRNTEPRSAFPVPNDFRPLSPLVSHTVAKRWCYYSQPLHYVYALCHKNGIPFYVGLGKANRAVSHLQESVRIRQTERQPEEKHQEILAAHDSGSGIWYHFLALTKSRRLAEGTEAYWIDLWGIRNRGGMLTNLDPLKSPFKSPPPPRPIEDDEPTDQGSQSILTFEHPDYAVAIEETDESGRLNHAIECCACGSKLRTLRNDRPVHLICPCCGHYVYGIEFRDIFPVKQFTQEEVTWNTRKPPPPYW